MNKKLKFSFNNESKMLLDFSLENEAKKIDQ